MLQVYVQPSQGGHHLAMKHKARTPALFLPLCSSVVLASPFASPGFSFLILKTEVKIVPPSKMLMKKKAINADKMLSKVSAQHKISIQCTPILLIISLDMGYSACERHA